MSAPVPFEGVLLVLPSARRSIPSAIVIDSSPTAKDVQRSRLPAPRGRKVGFGGGWPPAPLFNHVTRYRNFADAEDNRTAGKGTIEKEEVIFNLLFALNTNLCHFFWLVAGNFTGMI